MSTLEQRYGVNTNFGPWVWTALVTTGEDTYHEEHLTNLDTGAEIRLESYLDAQEETQWQMVLYAAAGDLRRVLANYGPDVLLATDALQDVARSLRASLLPGT